MSTLINVRIPDAFYDFWDKSQETPLSEYQDTISRQDSGFVTPLVGFEDVLNGRTLGTGSIYNHSGATLQLIASVSVLAESATVTALEETASGSMRDTVALMRERQVLHGRKIIDLGCGVPTFALSASSLGAEVHTADMQVIPDRYKARLHGHTVVDFNQADSLAVLLESTGGSFDFVTSNMVIFEQPYATRGGITGDQVVANLALGLLSDRGYLASELAMDLKQKVPS